MCELINWGKTYLVFYNSDEIIVNKNRKNYCDNEIDDNVEKDHFILYF